MLAQLSHVSHTRAELHRRSHLPRSRAACRASPEAPMAAVARNHLAISVHLSLGAPQWAPVASLACRRNGISAHPGLPRGPIGSLTKSSRGCGGMPPSHHFVAHTHTSAGARSNILGDQWGVYSDGSGQTGGGRDWAESGRGVRGGAMWGGWGIGAMGWDWLAAAVRKQGGDAGRVAGSTERTGQRSWGAPLGAPERTGQRASLGAPERTGQRAWGAALGAPERTGQRAWGAPLGAPERTGQRAWGAPLGAPERTGHPKAPHPESPRPEPPRGSHALTSPRRHISQVRRGPIRNHIESFSGRGRMPQPRNVG